MWDYISSKPAIGSFAVNGAFDSHTLPPVFNNLECHEITGNQFSCGMAIANTLECACAVSSLIRSS